LEATAMRDIVEAMEALLPAEAWPAWTGSNHDMFRFPTRWAGADERKIRAALLMLFGLRGTPVLYQGDEIGQGDTVVTPPDLRDPLGVDYWPAYAGRDAGRTPMQWSDTPGGGFTAPATKPWLPLGVTTRANVEGQHDDPASVLALTRALVALRRENADLRTGAYASWPAPDGVWVWQRGVRTLVGLNLSEHDAGIAGVTGAVRLSTIPARCGARVQDGLPLAAWEGVIVELEVPTA
jgi:alpha-glucosidase